MDAIKAVIEATKARLLETDEDRARTAAALARAKVKVAEAEADLVRQYREIIAALESHPNGAVTFAEAIGNLRARIEGPTPPGGSREAEPQSPDACSVSAARTPAG